MPHQYNADAKDIETATGTESFSDRYAQQRIWEDLSDRQDDCCKCWGALFSSISGTGFLIFLIAQPEEQRQATLQALPWLMLVALLTVLGCVCVVVPAYFMLKLLCLWLDGTIRRLWRSRTHPTLHVAATTTTEELQTNALLKTV